MEVKPASAMKGWTRETFFMLPADAQATLLAEGAVVVVTEIADKCEKVESDTSNKSDKKKSILDLQQKLKEMHKSTDISEESTSSKEAASFSVDGSVVAATSPHDEVLMPITYI